MEEGEFNGQATSDIQKQNLFDIKSLHDYICPLLNVDINEEMKVVEFNLGQSNPTFLITLANVKYVMRKMPKGKQLSQTAHRIDREYKIYKALAETPVPVPKVYFYCNDSDIIGTPFFLMEFVQGRIFKDNTFEGLCASDREECYKSMVKTLAHLHKVNYMEVGLHDYGKTTSFYTRQVSTMLKTSNAQSKANAPSLPNLEELCTWYSANLPSDEICIVHGDFKPDNMIFHPHKPEVIAVLDWELSSLGHPLSDLANVTLAYHYPPDFLVPTIRDSLIPGLPNEEDVLKNYCKLTGRIYPIIGWKFCVSFAFFRLSVILQGVASRAANGRASSAQASFVGAFANPVAQEAFNIIKDRNFDSLYNKSKL